MSVGRTLLAASVSLALCAVASASPAKLPANRAWAPTCADHSCKSRKLVDAHGALVTSATPSGILATDIEKAYHIDPSLGAGVTVAVVDAYGYAALEADLAVYRSTFGLPACTTASGCLTIVNDHAETSPLPADDPDWIVETALDVDMVSAACPACKIVVVQASAGGVGLDIGQAAAVQMKVTAISNSWGDAEYPGVAQEEASFDNPGVGTFSGGGDNGYDSVQPGDVGPVYPSTSAHVIAVGGTTMTLDSSQARGYAEVAWTHGGSSCSTNIPKPSFQPADAACNMRAATDVSAAADGGSQGIAIYVAQDGGWTQVDGTSAASPMTTAIFAASGHGDAVPAFIYKHPEAFLDITQGTNGSCNSTLCNAGQGWDGPTGMGTPDEQKLAAIGGAVGSGPPVTFTYPATGDTLAAGFAIQVAPDPSATYTEVDIDGVEIGAVNAAPFIVSAPMALADGTHTVTAIAYDLDHNSGSASIDITQGGPVGADSSSGGGGGCAATGGAGSGGLALALGALLVPRRRR